MNFPVTAVDDQLVDGTQNVNITPNEGSFVAFASAELDVTDDARISALADQYKDTPIDVLLNNAGIFTEREGQLLGSLDYDDFKLTMDVNAYAPLRMAEAFTDHVAASEQKKIITIV